MGVTGILGAASFGAFKLGTNVSETATVASRLALLGVG